MLRGTVVVYCLAVRVVPLDKPFTALHSVRSPRQEDAYVQISFFCHYRF
jgi:hypothetical protein